ncbi:hypothetical protein BB561_003237 [Smittium simulii]|uniref:Protein arginine methyltransferase NDUFAF7 n=1 Tax=Smittium simulii TaxID=133385 RepID=A0A2T9YMD7_9FUNG|nr:hypothetical protein BB561_003237 [Smittium simulii]
MFKTRPLTAILQKTYQDIVRKPVFSRNSTLYTQIAFSSTENNPQKRIKLVTNKPTDKKKDLSEPISKSTPKENKLDGLVAAAFGPWWPKTDDFLDSDNVLNDLGRRVTFDMLIKPSPDQRSNMTSAEGSNDVCVLPKHVHMLASDFINNSLYNPSYGYFSKQAMIFSTNIAYQYQDIRDTSQLLEKVGQLYSDMERELEGVESIPRQIWHTPSELLKPWYGYSVANCVLQKYKNQTANIADNKRPPLVVYEIGAGNGTLMIDFLKFISTNEPQIYENMEYTVIEISTRLARKQLSRKLGTEITKPPKKISIINKSIFDWDKLDDRKCFVLVMEVIDNFSHDVVRYDYATGDPYQCLVYIDKNGDFHEVMEPVNDPNIKEYLQICSDVGHTSPVRRSSLWKKLRYQLPFCPNTTKHEYLATNMMQVCKILFSKFPNHNLVLSDFYHLPDTVEGENGPVVQTRYKGNMVPCSTFMVQPGWFDIFFPTNFELLRDIYIAISKQFESPIINQNSQEDTVQLQSERNNTTRNPQVLTHEEFAKIYADLDKTKTKSGENPMLELYKNNKFLLS